MISIKIDHSAYSTIDVQFDCPKCKSQIKETIRIPAMNINAESDSDSAAVNQDDGDVYCKNQKCEASYSYVIGSAPSGDLKFLELDGNYRNNELNQFELYNLKLV